MSDAEDDYWGAADGDDPEDDGMAYDDTFDDGFGMGGDDDVAPMPRIDGSGSDYAELVADAATGYGLFQIASPTPGTFYTEDGRKGRASYLPSDIKVAFDPAMPDGMMIMVDEAAELIGPSGTGKTSHLPKPDWAELARRGRKTDISTDWVNQRFPSLKKFVEQYSKFVPQKINNPEEKEHTMDMAGLARMRADLEGMLSKFTSMVAIVERFGGEPGEGSVIKFEHTFDNGGLVNDQKVYDYVAVRKFNKWYVSGRPFAGQAISWAKLLEFIGDGRAWVCSEFTEVPLPGASATAADENKAAAVANLLANAGGRDTADVAAEVVALLNESK